MITFEQIRMKNFLSSGEQPLTFYLNKSPTTIITGSNGVGKTSIIDGITFSLFGKSFRDIKKGSLINSINKKNSYTQIIFTKGNTRYKILRGQKPHRLEIEVNGMLMQETASIIETQKYIEKQILGFDYNTFTRVCVMSTMNYTPFMALTSFERRNFVENMLDLKMFSEMNKLHKAETAELKDTISNIDSKLTVINTQLIEKRNFINYIKINTDDDLKAHKDSLASALKEIEEIDEKINKLSSNEELITKPLNDLKLKLQEYKKQNISINSRISVNNSKIKENNSTITYITNHDDCDLCKQKIDDENTAKIIKKLTETIDAIESETYKEKDLIEINNPIISDLESKIKEYTDLSLSFSQKISNLKQMKSMLVKNSKVSADNIKKIKDKSNVNADAIEDEVQTLIKQEDILKQDFEEKTEELKISNTVLELLKDTGIKADIIKQYIPMLVGYVNSYLSKLNIALTFEMDENFNEIITTRYTDNFTYNNLSAGERSRVDLALAFAWRMVAKAKGSVHTNLLILDEVLDANLDDAGTQASLDIVENISQDNTNIFIVSHKSNLEEHVRSILSLEKIDGFTQIK